MAFLGFGRRGLPFEEMVPMSWQRRRRSCSPPKTTFVVEGLGHMCLTGVFKGCGVSVQEFEGCTVEARKLEHH